MLDVIKMYQEKGSSATKTFVESLSKPEQKFIYSTQVMGLLSGMEIRKQLDQIFIPLISVKTSKNQINSLKQKQKAQAYFFR